LKQKSLYSPHSSKDGLYENLSSYLLALFYLMKSVLSKQSRLPNHVEGSNLFSEKKCMVAAFFIERFEEKEGGLST
jgi:hypothetical protein